MPTNTFNPQWPISSINAETPRKASEAMQVGDLLYYDPVNLCTRSASNFTDAGSAAATQEAFANAFAGVSNAQYLSTDATTEITVTNAPGVRVLTDLVWEFPCVSNTFVIGDYVAPSYSAGLSNTTLAKVTDPSLAIGRVVKAYATATTVVKCRLTSSLFMGKLVTGSNATDFANVWANFRNALDGGDFTVNPWQRGTTFTAIANTVTYTADRWFADGGASSSISVSQQSQTDVLGFGNSLRWGRGGGTDTATIYLGQVLETLDSIKFQGRQVTLSFWAKAGAQWSGASLAVSVSASTTAGNDTAAHLVAASTNWPATPQVINSTCVPTTTVQRFSFTGTVPATATQLGVLFSYAPTGTNNTTDTIDFYGIQLEDGGGATPFEHRDVEVELALCQRWYVRITEANGAMFGVGVPTGANTQSYSIWLPTPMRVAPTTVTWTVGGFKLNIDGGGSTTAPTTPAAGSTHSPTIITLTTANTLTAAAHSIGLFGTGTTGFITASADL